MEVFSLILGIVKAIPIVDSWFQQFFVYYFNSQIDKMKEENRLAIAKVINEKDQRDLEKALGSKKAGEASGDPDAVIVDSLPGV